MIDPISILKREGDSLPRYTSYPTAPHFAPDLGSTLMEDMLAALSPEAEVSIYLHIPFCDRLCWFCGCHTKQTRQYAPVQRYVECLVREIALFQGRTGVRPRARHIHLGGGSPTMLRAEDALLIRQALEGAFVIDETTETSVEIDPSDVDADRLDALGKLGLTRASIGVQDFDLRVQAAINRPQSFAETRDVVMALRGMGVQSLNIDALYGLPHQTQESVGRTIAQVVSLAPDRVALFGYAHVPWVKKHQTMIPEAALPDLAARFRQACHASDHLVEAGYETIGIDHFAKPHDALAMAARQGRLKRNFQGYTADTCETLIGFGASSIGRFAQGYIQNIVPTGQYEACVLAGQLPAAKGFRLSVDDVIRGHIIERLMCDFRLSFNDLRQKFGQAAESYIDEAIGLANSHHPQLTHLANDSLVIEPAARPLARLVAASFDAYRHLGGFRFSKAI